MRACFWISLATVAMVCSTAAAQTTLPDGFLGLKLGMPVADVEKAFPTMTKPTMISNAENGKSVVTGSAIMDQKLGPFDCDLELRFVNDVLFYIIVDYGHRVSPRQVQEYLEQQYGKAKVTNLWFSETVALQHVVDKRCFTLTDLPQYKIIEYLFRQKEGWVEPINRIMAPKLPQRPRPFLPSKVRFSDPRSVAIGGGGTFGVATGDLNKDGKLDVVATGHGDASIWTLKGKGDGTFEPAVTTSVGKIPRGLAIADLDGDGRSDVAVATDVGVWVLLSKPDGTLAKGTAYTCGISPYTVVAGDLNGDGKLDLVVSNESNVLPKFDKIPGTVSVLLNAGNGKFQAAVDFPAHQFPSGVALGDFDRDGALDLMVSNWGSNDLSYLRGNGKGRFEEPVSLPIDGLTAYTVVAAPLGKEQTLSAITTELGHVSVQSFQRGADGKFVSRFQGEVDRAPRTIATGDIDGDGLTDVVTANSSSDTVSVLLGQPDGGLAVTLEPKVGKHPHWVAIGDFNGDGKPDLVTSLLDERTITVLLNETPK